MADDHGVKDCIEKFDHPMNFGKAPHMHTGGIVGLSNVVEGHSHVADLNKKDARFQSAWPWPDPEESAELIRLAERGIQAERRHYQAQHRKEVERRIEEESARMLKPNDLTPEQVKSLADSVQPHYRDRYRKNLESMPEPLRTHFLNGMPVKNERGETLYTPEVPEWLKKEGAK